MALLFSCFFRIHVRRFFLIDRRALFTQYQQRPKQIEFKTISFDALDEEIVKSSDETGTVQVGWRRERNTYFSNSIFLRQHLADLRNALDEFMGHHQHRHMYISGPPGSGKTTYCLFYFTRYMVTNNNGDSSSNNKKGLIVQYRAESSNEIMILEGQRIRRVSSFKTHNKSMPDLLCELIEKEGKDSFDFCVFDGVRQAKDICENISSAITNSVGTKTKIIKITSLEFDIKGGESTGGIHGIDSFFVVSSWKLGDYEDAVKAKLSGFDELQTILCLDSDFEPDDQDEEMKDSQKEVEEEGTMEVTLEWLISLLKRKYFYAGGSARFMFDYSIDELIGSTKTQPQNSVFGKLCGRMTQEDWSSFAQLKISSSTPSSVSSGMQLIDGKYIPVSEYFLHVAHKECKEQLTASVRAAADSSNNPALKGWAFELEQLDVIEQVIKTDPRILVSEDRALVLPISSGETTTYDGRSVENVTSDAFTIWCSRWNQGCFDVAFYVKPNLFTMNFTVAESHSLKINPLRDLKDALEKSKKTVSSLSHIAVVEEKAKCDSFSFDEAEGVGKSVATVEFSVQTARSQKLIANTTPPVAPRCPTYGSALGTVQVYPREWVSSRKRKKVDYSGKC